MGNKSKTIGLLLLTITLFSCSSNDDTTPDNKKEKIIVLDRIEENVYSSGWENGDPADNQLANTSTYTFSYNDDAKVSAIDFSLKTTMPYDSDTYYKSLAVIDYNEEGNISIIRARDKNTELLEIKTKYEYNNQNQVVRGVGEENNLFYMYNPQEFIHQIQLIGDNSDHTAVFEYDERGNVLRAYRSSSPDKQDQFKYDTKHNPFKNMSFDMTYNDFEFAHTIMPFSKSVNNIISYTDSNNQEWGIIYKYNQDGYPIKGTSYNKKDPSKFDVVVEYFYKELEVKK